MVRRIWTFAALALLLALVVPSSSSSWKFVVMGDTQGPTWHGDTVNGVNVPALTNIVNRVNVENADFVLLPGDAVQGGGDDAQLLSEMQTWLGVMSNLNCPWYFTAGNHEVYTPTAEDVLRTLLTHQPNNGPPGQELLVYSFDHKNAHIVALNSSSYGQMRKIQQEWLDMDLVNTNQPHIFVFAHHPAYPIGHHVGNSLDAYPALRDQFWTTLTNHGVRMYFNGHEHHFARRLHGSVYQIHAATCGAPPYTGYPNTWPEYHYVVVNISGYNVFCAAKNADGAILDTWSYQVEPNPSIASTKGLPPGSLVTLNKKIVTAGTNRFANNFYIQDMDRSSGLLVIAIGKTANTGSMVNVTGSLTTSGGERALLVSDITIVHPNIPVPEPLATLTKNVGGGSVNDYDAGVEGGIGLHNTGLLVTVSGSVTHVDTTQRFFYIDEGSGLQDVYGQRGIRIRCDGVATGNPITLPAVDDYVTVTGISSRRIVSQKVIPAVRPRSQADIVVY